METLFRFSRDKTTANKQRLKPSKTLYILTTQKGYLMLLIQNGRKNAPLRLQYPGKVNFILIFEQRLEVTTAKCYGR